MPEKKRPFKLPDAKFVCLLAFYCCKLFSYWTGWETISKLGIVLSAGLVIFAISCARGSIKVQKNEIKTAFWILPYLTGIIFISYLGSFGGHGVIPFGWDFLIIALFSYFIFHMAIKSRVILDSKVVSDFLVSESAALEHG